MENLYDILEFSTGFGCMCVLLTTKALDETALMHLLPAYTSVNSENFAKVLFSQNFADTRSFVKIKTLRNEEITLQFTDVGKSCPSHKFLMSQSCMLMLFLNFNAISEFTV